MTQYMAVPVPASPPPPPQVTLIDSAIKPKLKYEQEGIASGEWDIPGAQLAMLPDELRQELQARKGDTWVRGFTYAPENRYQAVLRDRCNFTTVDTPALSAPTGLTLTPSNSGGTLSNAGSPYSYQVTAVNANGETTALTAVSTTIASGTTGSVKLVWNPTAEDGGGEPGGISYNVYGRVGGSIGKIASGLTFDDDQTPTYTDTGSPAPGTAPPGSNTTGGPGTYTNLPTITVVPYLVMVEDWCSTWGWSERDFKGRALRLLENAKYAAVEKEFWGGAFAQAQGYPNPYLASSDTTNAMGQTVVITPGSIPSVARGQQILQDALQQCGFGGQGMIHVQAQTAPNLLNARRVGNLLLDVFDNIVVPGVGYPGTGPVGDANFSPGAGNAWMFASPMVEFREEDEGTVFPDTFAEALDWGQGGFPNTLRFRAMKFCAAYMDNSCVFATRVVLAT